MKRTMTEQVKIFPTKDDEIQVKDKTGFVCGKARAFNEGESRFQGGQIVEVFFDNEPESLSKRVFVQYSHFILLNPGEPGKKVFMVQEDWVRDTLNNGMKFEYRNTREEKVVEYRPGFNVELKSYTIVRTALEKAGLCIAVVRQALGHLMHDQKVAKQKEMAEKQKAKQLVTTNKG